MAKLLCRLLVYLNHVIVANFYVANMSFNTICENKILAKISEFTVYACIYILSPSYTVTILGHGRATTHPDLSNRDASA